MAFGVVIFMMQADDPTQPTPTGGIVSIEMTSQSGDTAVYTITYDDGKTATLDVTDKAPDGSGAKVTGVSFDENSNIYLSLATGKLLNMGQAVGKASGNTSLQGHRAMTLSVHHFVMLDNSTDATTVAGVEVDEQENMSYELNNGKHLALGHVHKKGEGDGDTSMSMACINEAGELVIGFASGETMNLGRVVGKDGKDGVGIEGITLSDAGELSVALTNGTVLNLGNIKGQDGIGIAESKINDAGELVLTYTDGNSVNLGRVVGEKGEDGVGIGSININDAGELTIVLTDGTNLNLGNIKGEDGKSAYELYKEKYGYEGTEEEWLFDLVNGNLATKVKYPVTFDTAGGSEVPTQDIEEGGKVIEPTTTRAGYTFMGWYLGEELWSFAGYSITEPITLTAKWEIITYNIAYKNVYPAKTAGGKTSYTVEDEITVRNLAYYMDDNGKSLEGRTFIGWTYGDITTPTKDLVIPKGTTGNLTVKAHWDVQEKFQFNVAPVDNMKNAKTFDTTSFYAYTNPKSQVYAVCDGVVKSVKQENDTYTLVLTLDYDLSGKKTVTYKGIGTLAEGIVQDAHVSAGDVLGQTIDTSLSHILLTFNGSGKQCKSYFSAQALGSIQVSETDYGKHAIFTAEDICYFANSSPSESLIGNMKDGYAAITYTENPGEGANMLVNDAGNLSFNFRPQYLMIRYRTTREDALLHIADSTSNSSFGTPFPVTWDNTGEWATLVIDISQAVTTNDITFFFLDLYGTFITEPWALDPIDFAYFGLFDTQESANAFAADFG